MAAIGRRRIAFEGPLALQRVDGRLVLRAQVRVTAPVVLFPFFRIRIESASGAAVESNSRDRQMIGWLPRGQYRVDVMLPNPAPPGAARYRMESGQREALADVVEDLVEGGFESPTPTGGPATGLLWSVEAIAPSAPLASLSWAKGHVDWFYRHFDHAGPTIISYLLGDSPLLRGRILDVGCGDGITDLSVALRTGCQELVGIDPFRGYERLPGIIADNHLPPDVVPANLRFMPESGEAIPFADDSFDVVLSWGSLEHIAGGYAKALSEIRRVLRPGGLFFVHPGLYYSHFGHHLGEFSSEPHFHLKKPLEEVKRIVFETPPNYMDRSGELATPQQYWQWFNELNPIKVGDFERELRAMDFEPWRVAIRTQDLIEYTPELQRYSMQDLATNELYMSCISRKRA